MKDHKYYMDKAYGAAYFSRDKSTKVGCVIVTDYFEVGSYNSFPRNVSYNVEARNERPIKYIFTEHAERNVINNCARTGLSTNGATMYTTLMPCHECARSIIQAGIKTVVYSDDANERFVKSSEYARVMFKESGVELIKFHDDINFKKGDIIENNQDVLRRIVSFNGDSYIWEYADIPSGEHNEFDSINSNDPLFENWVKVN